MNPTPNWHIISLAVQDQPPLQQVVYLVRWQRYLFSGTVRYSVQQTTTLAPADTENFVSWSDLTADLVIQWLQDQVPAEQVQQLDDYLISMTSALPVLKPGELTPPWVSDQN